MLREAVFLEMHRGVWLIFLQRAQIGEKRSSLVDGEVKRDGDGGGWDQQGYLGEWEQLVQLKTLLQTCNCTKDLRLGDRGGSGLVVNGSN